MFFFFKQKTAYEMRISDWSSDVCSSDLLLRSLRGSVLIQVFPCAVDMGAHGQKMALNEVRLARRRHADGNVGLAHGEVELAVAQDKADQIGRASCRERVCQYV